MVKGTIKHIQNLGKIHRYVIPKQENIHGLFCNLLSDLNFSKHKINELDIIFDNLENDYIYITNPKFEIHFFITTDFVNMVIKSEIPQKELNLIIKNYFNFPH